MAEFVEVVEKAKKICERHDGCSGCPFENMGIVCDWIIPTEKLCEVESAVIGYNLDSDVDWSTVEVDTPIYVRDSKEDEWVSRHFAEYVGGTLYAWGGGTTSFTSEGKKADWNYAKLAGSTTQSNNIKEQILNIVTCEKNCPNGPKTCFDCMADKLDAIQDILKYKVF